MLLHSTWEISSLRFLLDGASPSDHSLVGCQGATQRIYMFWKVSKRGEASFLLGLTSA